MIDLQALYTYVYNTCRVLTDPLFCLPLDLSLDVSRIILLRLHALGIPPSFLIAVCYLCFLFCESPTFALVQLN